MTNHNFHIVPDVLKNAPMGFFRSTPEGKFLAVNQTLAQMHGYDTPEEFISSVTDIAGQLYPDSTDRKSLTRSLEQNGYLTNFENRARRRDGSVFWESITAEAIKDKDGKIICYQGFSTDISARKKTEEELKEKTQLLQTISDNVFDLVSLTDLEGIYKFAGASHAILGYDPGFLIGRNVFEYVHPDDLPEIASAFKTFLAERQNNQKVEYRYLCADGSYLWLETAGRFIYDALGNPKEIVFSSRDITERRQMEKEALRERLEELEALMNVAPVAIWISRDPKCDHIIGNRMANSFYEAYMDENISANVTNVRHFFRDGRQLTASELPMQEAAARNIHIRNTEMSFLSPSGKRMDLLGSASPLHDADGQVRGCIAAFTDITDRKRSEEVMARMNETLEQKVNERTALAEARAKQLQSLAVQLMNVEEMERRRIADLLHEDLQQIIASARMRLQVNIDKSPHELPDLVEVDQLLKESIEKSRSLSHDLSPSVMYHSGIRYALQWLAKRNKEKFGLDVILHENTPMVLDNLPLKIFLFRAVQELLFNITKHARVTIAEIDLSGSDKEIIIKVSDKGVGFDPEILNQHTENRGFGLLSLKERAQALKGDLLIESAPGKGSCFTLTFPWQ